METELKDRFNNAFAMNMKIFNVLAEDPKRLNDYMIVLQKELFKAYAGIPCDYKTNAKNLGNMVRGKFNFDFDRMRTELILQNGEKLTRLI